jgi:protein-S-isoprenylcysteine O-methyltransferase Ste14
MGIGISIVLLVLGLILVLDAVSLPSAVTDVVATHTVGWICVVVGILGLVIAVATMRRGRDTTIVEERRYDA